MLTDTAFNCRRIPVVIFKILYYLQINKNCNRLVTCLATMRGCVMRCMQSSNTRLSVATVDSGQGNREIYNKNLSVKITSITLIDTIDSYNSINQYNPHCIDCLATSHQTVINQYSTTKQATHKTYGIGIFSLYSIKYLYTIHILTCDITICKIY